MPATRARSKSPGRRAKGEGDAEVASSDGGFDFNSPHVCLGVTIAILVGLVVHETGVPTQPQDFVKNFFGVFAGDVSVPHWPFGLLLTGHVINSCQNAGGGFWVGDLINCAINAFAGVMLVDFLNGHPSSIMSDEGNMTLVAIAWYFCNHDIPFSKFNVWDFLTGKIGRWLQPILDVCSLVFVTNMVLAAAGTSSTAGPLGFSVFTPLAMAMFAGAAGHFFPLNKGISVRSCSDDMYGALVIGAYVVFLPFLKGNAQVGSLVSAVHTPVSDFVGGHDVLAAVMVNHLFGQFIPFNPVGKVTDALKNAFNV